MTDYELYVRRWHFGLLALTSGFWITDDFGNLAKLSFVQNRKVAQFHTSGRVLR